MNERTTLLHDAQRIIDNAKSENRLLTGDERAKVSANIARVKSLDANPIDDEDAELRRKLGNVLRDEPAAGEVGRFSAKTAAAALTTKMNAGGSKALAPSGAEVAPAGLTELAPLSLSKPATTLLAAVGAQVLTTPPTFAYLRQTTRTNNAATVASGGVKPTSIYSLERIEDRLRVVAHVSDPLDKFWLDDSAELRTFLEDELAYGVDVAVEKQLLSGDGLGENNRGMLATTGILAQAWSVDGYETVRKALTKLQLAGAETYVVALHPADFETMSLVRSTTNAFLATEANMSSDSGGGTAPPFGPTALTSWGAPLVLSNALTVGQGVAFDPSAVTLYVDGNVAIEWATSGDDFTKNQIRARAETRVGVAVKRPDRIVSLDMSAAV